MSTVSTFGAFSMAKLGIWASQKAMQVTGNNITNINTPGYTRQRLDQISLKTGGNDMYRSFYDNHIGNGALVTGINQVRDPYLDIRYRNTAADVGYTDTMAAGLKEIASILDEVGKGENKGDGILYAQIKGLADSLSKLGADPSKDNDILTRNSAQALCTLFNTYAGKLETLRKNTEDGFQKDLDSVNEILTNIRNLNESIRNSEIHGDNALEMRDERNRQIDALAEYMQIKVEYTMEDIGAGKQVEKLTISLGNANPDPNVHTDEAVLIDGIYGSQISMPAQKPQVNPNFGVNGDDNLYLMADGTGTNSLGHAAKVDNDNYTLVVSKLVDSKGRLPIDPKVNEGHPLALDDNDLYGSLQAVRELLTEAGEFTTKDTVANIDENASIKRGIPYFQKSLDLLARQFADQFNKLNNGTPVDENGDPIAPGTMVTVTMPTMKEAADGTISIIDPATGEYQEKPGWKLDKNTGYTVKDGNYVGLHEASCIITKSPIPVLAADNSNIEAVFTGLKGTGFDDARCAKIDAMTGEDRITAIKDLLSDCLNQHGVKPSDTTEITKEVELPEGGVLFSNRNDNDDPTNINASNIDISHSWSTGATKVVPTWIVLHDGTINNTTKNENVDHMLSKLDEALVYDPTTLVEDAVSSKLFVGSFNDMFSNMSSVLGNEQRVHNVQLNTHYTSLVEIDTSRDGVSGVDLNDEAMNMTQFQKAYSAACRLMTAIDEALDRLINNTGIAGR